MADIFIRALPKYAPDLIVLLGLGLALCKSIITAHGGEITVADHAPHGTVFTFTIPIEEVELHE